jgi:hypothetical protein
MGSYGADRILNSINMRLKQIRRNLTLLKRNYRDPNYEMKAHWEMKLHNMLHLRKEYKIYKFCEYW